MKAKPSAKPAAKAQSKAKPKPTPKAKAAPAKRAPAKAPARAKPAPKPAATPAKPRKPAAKAKKSTKPKLLEFREVPSPPASKPRRAPTPPAPAASPAPPPTPAGPPARQRPPVPVKNIVLFGATGRIGERIMKEALARGHTVLCALREPTKIDSFHPRVKTVRADVTDPVHVAAVARNRDAVISAVGPGHGDPQMLVAAARALVKGCRDARTTRLIVIGGAGSLTVPSGQQLLETPEFPADWLPTAKAHREALYWIQDRAEGMQWTVVSPPAMIDPGRRTGRYRTGTNQLLTDDSGQSRISMEDYAVAVLDELDYPANAGRRMTVCN